MRAIENLQRAIEFLDQCRADPSAGPVGALRDAVEWVELASREVLADDAITAYYSEKRHSGQPPPMPR